MKGCKPGFAPIFKGDRLNKDQCPKNDVEKAAIKDIPVLCEALCILQCALDRILPMQ